MFSHVEAGAKRQCTRRLLMAVFASIGLVAAACGSDGAETAVAPEPSEETETETVEASPAEGQGEPEPESSDPDADPDDLLGTWINPGGVVWEITADGMITVTGGAVEEASYTATSTTFEWADAVCPDPGKYKWEIVDDVLTLTLISDTCEGRNTGFDGRTMTRQ